MQGCGGGEDGNRVTTPGGVGKRSINSNHPDIWSPPLEERMRETERMMCPYTVVRGNWPRSRGGGNSYPAVKSMRRVRGDKNFSNGSESPSPAPVVCARVLSPPPSISPKATRRASPSKQHIGALPPHLPNDSVEIGRVGVSSTPLTG